MQQHPDEVAKCLEANRANRAIRDSLIEAVRAAKAGGDLAAQLAAVRAKLAEYYKPDEAAAFRLASTKDAAVVYAPPSPTAGDLARVREGQVHDRPAEATARDARAAAAPGTPPAAPP